MSQGLHLSQRMALSQVLAPQLQQSLALLQAPTLELKAMVEQELQMNPMLEELQAQLDANGESSASPDGDNKEGASAADLAEPPADTKFDSNQEPESADNNTERDEFEAEFERLTQMDQDWRDSMSLGSGRIRQADDEEEKRQHMFDSLVATTSLQEELQEQVRLSELTEQQVSVAEMIIGNIDDHGFLQASVEELAFATNIDPEPILEVLKILQSFHPPGVAARDLRECLMIQLERAGRSDSLEYRMIDKKMDLLGKRRLPEMAKYFAVPVEEVQQAVERIGHLEPRPGRDYMVESHQYIHPEVFVEKDGDGFVVTNNNDQVPHLRISNVYKDLMSRSGCTDEVKDYIRDKIRAGKFLIKSLHQRQETILNIGREIVKRQEEFMVEGVSKLKPMTMVQVAEAVGVHETTVSRAVSGKYIQTPQGVFEMKYFFTSGIQTESGSGVSNTSVKEMLQEMVKKEDPRKPLSDEELVRRLTEKGMKIARRTVAKYRSELNILPSHLRRSYI